MVKTLNNGRSLRLTTLNSCEDVDLNKWEANMKPLFAFEKAGSHQISDINSSLGIGLSTVNALLKAIKGEFWI